MKRAGSFLVLCAMLILSLTACGTKPADTNNAAGTGTSVTDSAKTRTRTMMDEGKQMMLDAKYYAAPNGRVRGMGKDSLMNEMRSATDKAAKDIRQAGDDMDKALSDMTRN
ncbi:MAG: hypothetical protein IJB75_07840 [Oscillospiraceae bacterium]|nr:hypothetical protein [Oscillospiraceae bacterium]